jgi:AcrR family transcriptional regulator
VTNSRQRIRRSRDEWLAAALEVLSRDPSHLRIDEIANQLGVSKGSFYWHFEDRTAFAVALAEYWKDTLTESIRDTVHSMQGSPHERLLTLMKLIEESGVGKHDLAVRAWARHEQAVLPIVRQVDRMRLKEVRNIFSDMGFEDPELAMRVRLFVVYHAFKDVLTVPLSRKASLEMRERVHAFFVRP